MLPTLLSLAALALASSPKIRLELVHSGDRTVHQKTIYVDSNGFLNAKEDGKVFTGTIDDKGVLTGVDDTPGIVGVNNGSPALKLYSDYTDTGAEFSLVKGVLEYSGSSNFVVCEDNGFQLWDTVQGGECSNAHGVLVLGLEQEGSNPAALQSTTIGPA